MNQRFVLTISLFLLGYVVAQGATFTVLPDMGCEFQQSLVRVMDDGSFLGFGAGEVSRWTIDGGHTVIAQVPTTLASIPLQATEISADGSTIICVVTNGDCTWPSSVQGGFRWTAATGVEWMPGFSDVFSIGVPTALSSDGSIYSDACASWNRGRGYFAGSADFAA